MMRCQPNQPCADWAELPLLQAKAAIGALARIARFVPHCRTNHFHFSGNTPARDAQNPNPGWDLKLSRDGLARLNFVVEINMTIYQ